MTNISLTKMNYSTLTNQIIIKKNSPYLLQEPYIIINI